MVEVERKKRVREIEEEEIKNSPGFATTRLGLILGRSLFLCSKKALQHPRI
ncbi:MAG: hypothetical protein V6S10_00870 [Candidatus Methanoglobus sp.]|jgi:hypothetical protein